MSRSPQSYAIIETAAGWCGIAWNDKGIIRFALPSTSRAGAERLILRRLPEALRGEPTPAIAAAIAAVRRYFAGEQMDFPD